MTTKYDIVIEQVKARDPHDAQKCVKYLGYVTGSPQETWKTRTVYVSDIVSKATPEQVLAYLDEQKDVLRGVVEEYYDNYLALKSAGVL